MTEGWKYSFRFAERTINLASDRLTIGRSRRCDVSINDPSVSRKHAFISLSTGKILLQDLGSSNGTFINEERITGEGELYDGDALRLGDAEIQVRIRPDKGSDGRTLPDRAPSLPAPPSGFTPAGPTLAGSSVAMLAPPLGELPGATGDDEGDDGDDEEPPHAGSSEHATEPSPALQPALKKEPKKPQRIQTFKPPAGLLERDDSLSLVAGGPEADDEPGQDGGLHGLGESGIGTLAPGPPPPSWREDSLSEETDQVPLIAQAVRRQAATFPLRAAAQLIDAAWVATLAWVAFRFGAQLGAVFVLLCSTVVPWIGWGLWGTTPGKGLLGLYVVGTDGEPIGLARSAGRLAALLLSILPLGAGFLMALSKDGLALHDRLAGTRVERRAF